MVLVPLQEMTAFEEVIINSPLTVSSDTSFTEAILQMSAARGSCSLADDTTLDRERFLAEARASCVLVVDGTKVLGIFTQRDVVRLSANGYQLTEKSVADVMAYPVIALRQSDFTDIFAVLTLFKLHHIRHLPIVDDNDQLIGLVTHESLRQMLRPIDLLRSRLVSEVMTTNMVYTSSTTSVLDLTRLMSENQVSSVVIVADDDETRAIGIVTERDIVQFHSLDLSFEKIPAQEVMSSPLFTVSPDDSLWKARSLMQEKHLNRVVVTDADGQLLGIVTQSTLLQGLNPVELYKLVETLEQKVSSLEKEKLDLLENRNTQLEQEIQKRTTELTNQAEKEKLLSSIAGRIRSSLDLQQTLNAIVQKVRTFLQCDRVFIYQFHQDWSGVIVAESVIENHESFLNQEINDPCFAPDWVDTYINGRIRVVPDIYQANLAPCHIELLEQIQTRAKILVPIVQEGQLWGLLSATQKDHPRDWQESEVNLLQQLSTQIVNSLQHRCSIAIQQADIYKQLRLELAERNRTEEALRQSEKRYASLAEAAPVGIFRTDAQGNCIYINERWCQMTGLSYEQAMGTGWINALHLEDREKVAQEWYTAAQANRPFRLEYRFQRPDGLVTWVFSQAVAERGENQQIIGYVGTITDINDRKQAEIALQERKELLSSIAENIADGYAYRLVIHPDGTVEVPYTSTSATKLFGQVKQSLSWQDTFATIAPEDKERCEQVMRDAMQGSGHLDNEYRIRDITGQIRWMNSRGQVRTREDGCVIIEGVTLDITERKQAQADLQALVEGAAAVTGNDLFTLLLEYIATFLDCRCALIVTKNGEYFQTSAFWADGNLQTNISGLLEEMPCNLTIAQGAFCCVSDLQQHFPNESFKELAAQSYVGVAIKSTEGETLGSLCLLDDKPLADSSRAIAILQVFAARVGAELERQQAMTALEQLNQELEIRVEERTAELRESQERWELALRGSNDGIWDWNIKANQVFYSTRWKQMRGFADDEIGSNLQEWSNLIHPDDYDRVMIAVADHLAHKTPFFQEEYRVQRKDGSYMWVLDRRQALWDETGNVLRMVGSESDITSRKQAEAELLAVTSLQQAIFDGIDYSIISTNPEGIIQTFNAAAEKMLGYTAKEVIGKVSPLQFHDHDELQQQAANISEIWGRNITPGMAVFITTAIQGIPNEQEWTYIRKDGSRFPVLLSVTTLYDDKQQIIGFVGIAKDITAKKQADEKLRRTIKELSDFKYALDQAAIVAITDSQGTITYANEKFSQISQYSQDELIGQTHKLVNSGYHSREFFAELWSTISSGNVWRGEIQNCSKDGSFYWVDTTIVPFVNDQGQPVQYLSIRTDITDRKQAEIALQESQRFAQSIADSSPNILYIHDLTTGHNLYINRELTSILGYTPGDLARMGSQVLQQLLHPEDLVAYFAHQQQLQAATDDEILEIEYRVRNINATWRWLSARDAVFKRNSEGRAIQYIGVAQDITERKDASEALEKYAREVEDLYNNAPCGYYSLDSEGIITGINNTQLQWLGYTREEMVGQKYINFLTEQGCQIFHENYPKFKEIGFVKDLEFSLIRKDGTVLPVLINATAVNSADGTYLHSLSTVFDITDRREAEKKLKHQLAVIEAAVDGIAILENNIFTYVNQAHLQLFGYENSEELLGKTWQELYSLEESSRFEQEVFPVLMQQHHWQGEATATRKDGSTFTEGLSLTLTEGGNLISVCRDITDVKKAEQELRTINERLTLTNAELERATRLKDEFLANMSHELRTPLNAILGMSEGLQEEVFGVINQGQQKAIATIERSGRHLLELINDILDLSKIESGKLELQLTSVPVKNLADSSLPFIRQQAIKKNIHLTVGIPDTLGEIVVDELRICQVLINLLNNAVKFTPEGGNVRLEIELEGSYLVISVIDTGIGIAPDDASKLFKPFVQVDTKLSRQYSGTGLGLALVRRLVELHDGTVGVTSEIGQGSRFTVKLPYRQSSTPDLLPHPAVFPQCSLAPENRKVLIIEDTPTAAEQVTRYLDQIGMEGVVYPQGEGAIAQILAHQPALIILDIQLPHRSGWEVLAQIKAHAETQTIPVIIVSVVDERSRGLELGAAEYLIKPIIRQQLHQVINQLRQPPTAATHLESITVEEELPPTQQQPLILIAEDNEANIDTVSNYLESRGYHLLVAGNGLEAIDLAKTHAPDLILMDVQMPLMDGLEAIRLIRADDDIANIPIIALTGLAMPNDHERCLQAGANEYLAKPVRLKQLTKMIQNLLNK
ncbi:PAS domain S-box protein [Anabaena sphaerica FACHB-251]|uniref:histidine kinase n=1 Tax=Anabaena sphaerica FACHB-251 TaxID=2692883 RepID=A0A926WEG2_9NOST|nr:PAS domain S-box protein [Anabaena sphaerica]MBD2292917.1 PAS domain S-box protein [Anabaena sphaerica FACHB-251]